MTTRKLATLDGAVVFYLPSRVEYGMVPGRLGDFESTPLSMPGSTFCRVVAACVVFERQGLREEIDMSESRAEIERRFLSWSVCLSSFNGKPFEGHQNRLLRNKGRLLRRPRIAGFDPRLTVGAFVLLVLSVPTVFLSLPAMLFLIWCAYQSRCRAIEIGRLLNELSPLLPVKKRSRRGRRN